MLGAYPHGLTFGCLIPNYYARGDLLRLQFLNNVALKAEEICTASDYGAELLEYVVADHQRAKRIA